MDESGCDQDTCTEMARKEEEVARYREARETSYYNGKRTGCVYPVSSGSSFVDPSIPTGGAEHQDEHQGKDMQGRIVSSLLAPRPALWFSRRILPTAEFSL